MSRRTERVAELLRAELSGLLRFELKDPRLELASVSRVEVSPDLQYATVHVSVLGQEPQREQAIEALEHATGFIRTQLGKRLRLRAVPQLRFRLDRGAEHSQRISEILESLHDGEQSS